MVEEGFYVLLDCRYSIYLYLNAMSIAIIMNLFYLCKKVTHQRHRTNTSIRSELSNVHIIESESLVIH